MSFQCDKCGACCKFVYGTELDRGDGTCKHLAEDNTCSIYEDRPAICRVDAMYERFHKDACTREQYYEITNHICQQLKQITK